MHVPPLLPSALPPALPLALPPALSPALRSALGSPTGEADTLARNIDGTVEKQVFPAPTQRTDAMTKGAAKTWRWAVGPYFEHAVCFV